MSAIITEQFRRQNAEALLVDVTNQNNSYYIGIGQQDSWQEIEGSIGQLAPQPAGTNGDQRRVLEHVTGLFRTSNTASIVVPRYTVEATKQYKVYDAHDATCFYPSSGYEACFVCSKVSPSSTGNHIFLCIGKTIEATTASISASQLGNITYDSEGIYQFDDGYTWVYLGRILENSELNTNSFMAISDNTISVDAGIGSKSSGLFYGLHLLNGGNIYVNGNNLNANVKLSGYKIIDSIETYIEDTFPVKVNVSSGSISQIRFSDNVFDIANPPAPLAPDATQADIQLYNNALAAHNSFVNKYLYWDRAKVEIIPVQNGLTLLTGQDLPLQQRAASALANFAPINGFGANKFSTLPAWYVGFYCNTNRATYTPNGTEYRQISLIKNPKNRLTGETITDAEYIMPLKYFTRDTNSRAEIINNQLGAGWRLIQNGKEVGVISHIQTVTGNNDIDGEDLDAFRYYYYQDHRYGYGPEISNSDPLIFRAPLGSILPDYEIEDIDLVNQFSGDYKQNSGTVIFIDNRGTIQRSEGQNEELKVIIQL